MTATIHASAILVGPRALLIRGPSGSGKSRLVLDLLQAQQAGVIAFARLVGDDRVHLEARHGRLLVRPAQQLEGLLEIRGLGLRTLPFEPVAAVGRIVDLTAADAERLPAPAGGTVVLEGIALTRLAVAPGADARALALAFLGHSDAR